MQSEFRNNAHAMLNKLTECHYTDAGSKSVEKAIDVCWTNYNEQVVKRTTDIITVET